MTKSRQKSPICSVSGKLSLIQLLFQVKEDIEKFKFESVELENERKKILTDLENKLDATNTLKDGYDLKYDGTMKTLDQLKSGSLILFHEIITNL